MAKLTPLQREVLLFESTWAPGSRRRAEAIRERFGFSSNTYMKVLDEAVRADDARQLAPSVVQRRLHGKRRSTRPSNPSPEDGTSP